MMDLVALNHQKRLDLYIADYLKKHNMTDAYEAFVAETNISKQNPAIDDSKGGFLKEWWSLFYDVSVSRRQMSKETLNPTTSSGCSYPMDPSGVPTVSSGEFCYPNVIPTVYLGILRYPDGVSTVYTGELSNTDGIQTVYPGELCNPDGINTDGVQIVYPGELCNPDGIQTVYPGELCNSDGVQTVYPGELRYPDCFPTVYQRKLRYPDSVPTVYPGELRYAKGVNQTCAIKECQEPSSYLTTPNPVYFQRSREHQQPYQYLLQEPVPSLKNHNRSPFESCDDMDLPRTACLTNLFGGAQKQQAHSHGPLQSGSESSGMGNEQAHSHGSCQTGPYI